MTSILRAARDQVLAFRLAGHGLVERRPLRDLIEVVGAIGIRNTPPGSAQLGLHARLNDLTPKTVDDALAEEKRLVEVLGPRISPHLVPAGEIGVFTLGALPADEASLRGVLNTFAGQLDQAGITATAALEQATEAAHAELDAGPLSKGALSAGMTRRLSEALSLFCRACGSTHVFESLFRLVGVRGIWVIARSGRQSVYVRTDQWLDTPPHGDQRSLRATLLRRYLRGFGPSTAREFGEWLGIGAAEAQRDWERLADSLVQVDLEGRRGWIHVDDLADFEHPPRPIGVRLLPPYDGYLDQRDRATLIPDKALHRQVWAILGNPGAVLVDGEIAGTWRPRKKGKRLDVTVTAFGSLAPAARSAIEAEAALLGPIRGCTSVEVSFDG
jgi:hypothetical protein